MSKSPSKKTGKKLQEALELINEERYEDARAVLDQALRGKNLRPIDAASLNRFYGFTYTGNEQYLEGIPYFEDALALNVLAPKISLDLQFNLAQLYMATEQFSNAAGALRKWIATSEFPEARAHYYLAVALIQQDLLDEALPHAKIAVDMTETPKEAWMRLLLNLHFQKQMYSEMLPLLRYLVKYHPKKVYWAQLSAVYSELEEEQRSMAVQQLAYLQGYLNTDRDLRRLARMYLYHDIPYWAARIVAKGIDDESIEPDEESWELLANSWITAREFDRAVEPLTLAAELSESGDTYSRLSQVYIEREEWDNAIEAIQSGLEKGDLRNPGQAYLLLGISHYNQERYKSALSAFRQARTHEKTKKFASQWMTHVENTIANKARDEADV